MPSAVVSDLNFAAGRKPVRFRYALLDQDAGVGRGKRLAALWVLQMVQPSDRVQVAAGGSQAPDLQDALGVDHTLGRADIDEIVLRKQER